MKKIKKVAILPDMQIREDQHGKIVGIDLKTLKAVLAWLEDNYWDEVVQLGDFLDFNCISSFNDHQPGAVANQDITKDYRAGNLILDKICKAAQSKNKNVKIVLLEGNHEYRIIKAKYANPTLGITEIPTGLRLKERGIKWVQCFSASEFIQKFHKVGKLRLTHGMYGQDGHAKKHVTSLGVSILYGDRHDFQVYTWPRLGKNDNIIGMSIGCLCTSQEWERVANRWQQAVGVVYVWPGGDFQIQPILINNHRFVYNEKEYR